ncbi:MAG: DNA-binding protein [Epsilonproteobacteria bacterium]|nr:MAG: DNA-binding protein [Campylobacterota bacterium]
MKIGTFLTGLVISVQLFAVNLNTASIEELSTLKGVGTVTAQKIMDYRKSYKFKSIDEMKNVNGIGEKRFEKIKKDLSV